ncbi:MAG: ABC transporter permease [bacterium]
MSVLSLSMVHKPMAFLRRDFLGEISYRLSFVSQIAGVFFSVVMFYYISRLFGESASRSLSAYGGEYFPFVLIGIAFYRYMGVALSIFSSTIREGQMTGTLETMLTMPTRPILLLIYSSLWSFIYATFEVAVYLFFGVVFFGLRIGQANLFSVFVVLLTTILAFSSFGILSAAFVLIYKRGDPVSFIFGTLSALLGGVYYPVTILPEFLQRGSDFIPLTYSLRAMRHAILLGEPVTKLGPDIAVLILYAAVGIPMSLFLFNRALSRAKEQGSLAQF